MSASNEWTTRLFRAIEAMATLPAFACFVASTLSALGLHSGWQHLPACDSEQIFRPGVTAWRASRYFDTLVDLQVGRECESVHYVVYTCARTCART